MGTSIQFGTGFFGATATLLGFALVLIWVLFLIFGIRVRRTRLRIFGAVLTCITLSMVLGLWQSEVLPDGTVHGGAFGNWISGNCEPTGLAGLALFLAVVSFIAATLLSTDWLFLDYITGALGMGFETDYGGLPMSEKRLDWGGAPFSSGRPKKATRPEKKEKAAPVPPLETDTVQDVIARAAPVKATAATLEEPPVRKRWWEAPSAQAPEPSTPGKAAEPLSVVGADRTSETKTSDVEKSPMPLKQADEGVQETDDALVSAVMSFDAGVEEETMKAPGAHLPMQSGETFEDFDVEEMEESVLPEEALDEAPLNSVESVEPVESIGPVNTAPPTEARSPTPAPVLSDIEAPVLSEIEAPVLSDIEVPLKNVETKAPKKDSSFFERAAWLVVEEGEASVSTLQKRLNLGYFRSAKLIDQLEKNGIIAPPNRDAHRKVLISRVELQAFFEAL